MAKNKRIYEDKIKFGEVKETSDFDRRLAQIYQLAIQRYHEHNQEEAEGAQDQSSDARDAEAKTS